MNANEFRIGQRVYLASAPEVIGVVAVADTMIGAGGLSWEQARRWPDLSPNRVPVHWPGYDWWEDPTFLQGAA
ncbi:hypothetical protein H7I77_09920 [Mycolicibacterium novocastrense]|uniref:TonB-linked outer membrane protein, SusC/RagA family n=1 Tax=Mycolicibacterium novocastrense TaxID=59813 RepID=A0AAW5SKM7_MYCNV|nr:MULTISPECIES: hypothetical protein [Mycolicibacterium]MCV7023662.1 hypothetical protein [Mycolicibacterium novocastrense]MDX1886899.1 hypothetical protein [Mycolicibacterium sp. 120270]GAT07692.1 TonB-linked outer membrane protein, SusC/RagA family [Mycolicibacterium novocastrense]